MVRGAGKGVYCTDGVACSLPSLVTKHFELRLKTQEISSVTAKIAQVSYLAAIHK